MTNVNKVISTIAKIHAGASKLITDGLKEHNLEGLAPSHGDILVLLYKHEQGLAMRKVTQAIHKDKSTVTALVNKLEKMGFVEKCKSESDSRSTLVKLTQKGFETKPVVLESISTKLLEVSYEGFSQEEKELLTKLLEKMAKNFYKE